MKKKYSILLTLLAGGILGYFYLGYTSPKDSFHTESLSPKQIWENQMNERKEGESEKAGRPNEYTHYFKAITTKFGQEESAYPMNYKITELNLAKEKRKAIRSSKSFAPVWTERGPANVGGRTRGLIIDPDDATHSTWFAGSATGGVWKTTDKGQTWTNLTNDFPNLSANTLAMSASNHNVIYAGTGESFTGGSVSGSGILKSTDKGATWTQLMATASDKSFKYINRLVIDPSDDNIVVAATQMGIMKTTDGGLNWSKVYTAVGGVGVEDLREDPQDFNTLYATENSVGVLKSIDAGDNWTMSSEGIGAGSRIEIAVSPVNSNVIYASQEVSTTEAYVYRSVDKAVTWYRFEDKDGSNANFLKQGWYDNTIAGHPYNENIAYIGGVNLWKVDFDDPGTLAGNTEPGVIAAYTYNTQDFLSFINFSATYMNGGMEIGTENDATNITEADFVSVEVRFGPGMTQKAHRFTVPRNSGANSDGGAGVPASGYEYQDYVDVPFQVWDITNNKQLMASFRDQERNGIFDLIERIDADPVLGREYLFVNLVDYSETASADIAKDAGHSFKQMYFFWPTLADGGTWDDANLPDSKIHIKFGSVPLKLGTTYVVSDAYNSSNPNSYSQSAGFGQTVIPGLHPDHHNLVMVKTNEAANEFMVVNANDGGLAISEDNGVIFNQLPNNYQTTQFYGVAKSPGADEFIGGMQDNGTWRSPLGEVASSSTKYLFQIGGDGFECIWHASDADKIIGSVYNNSFSKTTNGGTSWSSATSGITDGDGPFISRLSSHKNTPDNLYAVGKSGIYKSTNFGSSWTKKAIGTGWLQEGRTAVTSQHNVEVSLANENIIWTGAAMSTDSGWSIFVSTDQGESFNPVKDYTGSDISGFISGMATHPTEDSTAYLLFSFPEETKIIKTKDLGETWEDISGYNGNTVSSNNFPDVVTQCLVVLPNDPSTIWVGTDIGIFESNDDGTSWHYANNGIPAVSIHDMFVQDGQVVVSTYGRGIWTASIDELNYIANITSGEYLGEQSISIDYSIEANVDSVLLFIDNKFANKSIDVVAGNYTSSGTVDTEGEHTIYMESYINNLSYKSTSYRVISDFKPVLNSVTRASEVNTIELKATFNENYDSLHIYVDNSYSESLASFELGENIMYIPISLTAYYDVKILGYMDGTAYESNTEEVYAIFVGLSDIFSVNALKVYPNPTSGTLTVELPENFTKTYDVDVYSLSGVKMFTTKMTRSDNLLNLENLKDGLYLIRLENEGELYTQKIQIKR